MASQDLTINDLVDSLGEYNDSLDPIYGSGEVIEDVNTEGFIFNQDFNDRLKTYNNKVSLIDPQYQTIIPLGYNVLVRVYCNTGEVEENKMTKIPVNKVSVPTASGYGKIMEIASPFPYKSLGVVISKGNHVSGLEVGDLVQLNAEAASVKAVGQGDDMSFYLPYAYIHPNYGDEEAPMDPLNPHYGYLLISMDKIIAIIKR